MYNLQTFSLSLWLVSDLSGGAVREAEGASVEAQLTDSIAFAAEAAERPRLTLLSAVAQPASPTARRGCIRSRTTPGAPLPRARLLEWFLAPSAPCPLACSLRKPPARLATRRLPPGASAGCAGPARCSGRSARGRPAESPLPLGALPPGTDAAGDAEAGPGRGALSSGHQPSLQHEWGEMTPRHRATAAMAGPRAWVHPAASRCPIRRGCRHGHCPGPGARWQARARGAGAGSAGSVPEPALSSACCCPY